MAKATFEAAFLVDGKGLQRRFAMTIPGVDTRHAWRRKQDVEQAPACLEAPGEYGAALALRRYEAGHVVSSVNPARSAAYAKRRLARTKTDKADATLSAHFCCTQHPLPWTPPPWTPPPAAVRALAAVREARVRGVERLQEVNRLHSGLHSPSVRASMEGTLAFLRQAIAKMQRLLESRDGALDGGAGAGRRRGCWPTASRCAPP